jgi:hypothetical protein
MMITDPGIMIGQARAGPLVTASSYSGSAGPGVTRAVQGCSASHRSTVTVPVTQRHGHGDHPSRRPAPRRQPRPSPARAVFKLVPVTNTMIELSLSVTRNEPESIRRRADRCGESRSRFQAEHWLHAPAAAARPGAGALAYGRPVENLHGFSISQH